MAAPWEKYQKAQAPWEKYQKPSESSPETDAEVNARVAAKYGNMSFGDKVKGDLKSVVSGVTPVLRGAWDAVSFVPGLAADFGVAARNLLPGQNYDLPTKQSEQALDTALPMPNTPGSKVLRFGTSLLAGAKLPTPQVDKPAPAGFVKPAQDLVRQQTLAASQKAGYVVPPSTTNPTMGNKIFESIGGKIATAQDAAAKNQDVTNTLAKRALGLSEDAPLTEQSLAALRAEAGDAYKTLRQVGTVTFDDASVKSMDELASKFAGSKLKDAMGEGNKIPKIVEALKSEPLNGNTAVDAIDSLRNEASKAYASGDKQLGKAFKTLSETVENLMEKNLSGEALKQFRDARQLIAKSYSVEGALNPSTGTVAATKLASQLSKGKPLSGDLKTIAQFGQAFPKAAQAITDSGSVRNTDVIMSAATTGLSKEPSWLLYPFARQAARNILLSPTGQKLATQTPSNGLPPELAMMLLQSGEQLRR